MEWLPMDLALKNALSAKKQIEADIAALKARLSKVEAFISLYDEFTQGLTDNSVGLAPAPPVEAESNKRQSIPDVVATILSDGYPRQTGVLLNLLDGRGVKVGGTRRIINLSSTLSRDSRFTNERGKGWRLTEPLKPASPPSVGAEEGLFN